MTAKIDIAKTLYQKLHGDKALLRLFDALQVQLKPLFEKTAGAANRQESGKSASALTAAAQAAATAQGSSLAAANEDNGKTEQGEKKEDKQKQPALTALRPTPYTSRYYYNRTLKLWHVLVATLPVDLCLTAARPYTGAVPALAAFLEIFLLLALVLSVAFLWRQKFVTVVLSFDELQNFWGTFTARYSAWVAGIAAALFFCELLWKFGAESFLSILVALVVTFGAVRSIRKSLRERSLHLARLKEDRTLWVEQNNLKVFYLALTPMVAARLVALLGCGATLFAPLYHEAAAICYVALSFLLLLTYHPQEAHFMITCHRCGLKTSIILRDLCPRCAAQSATQSGAAKGLTHFAEPPQSLTLLAKRFTSRAPGAERAAAARVLKK